MLHDHPNLRIAARCVAVALSAAAFIAGPAAKAQNMMRTPNLNIAPRAPNVLQEGDGSGTLTYPLGPILSPS